MASSPGPLRTSRTRRTTTSTVPTRSLSRRRTRTSNRSRSWWRSTVTEVNDTPAAKPDEFEVGSGAPTDIPNVTVLHNDIAGPANESGQGLTVAAVTASAQTHGTVSVAGGRITYDPDAGYTGPASFGYSLCDDGTTDGQPDPLCRADGSVSLVVTAPDSPPTADGQDLTTAEDVPLPLTLTGSDPDGDPLTFAIVDPPAHGSLVGTAPALVYTPAADYNGPDVFTFVASDGRVISEPATVTLSVTEVNDPPSARPRYGHARRRGHPRTSSDCAQVRRPVRR